MVKRSGIEYNPPPSLPPPSLPPPSLPPPSFPPLSLRPHSPPHHHHHHRLIQVRGRVRTAGKFREASVSLQVILEDDDGDGNEL